MPPAAEHMTWDFGWLEAFCIPTALGILRNVPAYVLCGVQRSCILYPPVGRRHFKVDKSGNKSTLAFPRFREAEALEAY